MLDYIELYNFKSYRGTQTIYLGRHAFTSVIGPNGSGKSNLMDAISFVLGVRSTTLRSSALKDLIYRSGRKVKGKGKSKASNQDEEDEEEEEEEAEEEEEEADGERKAWVKLVYIDKQKVEWQFQRSIANAGSSDYRLNGKPITHKLYNEQLEAFNILVKAKNFLVFQGDVESLSTLSPLDLSKLIERISGSLDLAADYDLASKKLDKATEESVAQHTRRKGVNGEIKVFKELKSEKERFEKLKEDLDDAIIHELLYKLYWIESKMAIKAESIEEINLNLPKLRENQVKGNELVKTAKKAVNLGNKVISESEKLINYQEKLKNQPKLDNLLIKLTHSTKKLSNSNLLLAKIKIEQTQKLKIRNDLQLDLIALQKARDAYHQQSKKEAQSQGNYHLTEADLKQYHDLKSSASLLEITSRQALSKILSSIKTIEAKLASQDDKLEVATRKQATLQDKEALLSSRESELQSKSQDVSKELRKVKQELNENQVKKAETAQTEAELNEKLAQVLVSLQQAGADRSQTNKEAKLRETLANLKRTFPGVIGRLCDLVKPTATKFNTAASTVLGRNNDSIVVDDERTAISCVEYLRVQRIAQQTFLPLSTIQAKPANEKYRAYHRGTRMAIDCLEYQPAIDKAVQFACGNTLICDSMEIARTVVYEKGQDVKVVTLEGTVIHKGGNITGGVTSGGQARHFEDREVEALRKKEAELKSKLADILKIRPRGNVDESLNIEITRLQSDLTLIQDDLNATSDRLKSARSELAVVEKEIKELTISSTSLKKELKQLKQSSNEPRQVIEAAEDGIFASFCERIKVSDIREYEEKQLSGAQGSNEQRLKFDTQVAKLGHQIKFETKGIESIEERITSYESSISKETKVISELNLEKEEDELKLGKIIEEIDKLKLNLATLTNESTLAGNKLEEEKKKLSKSNKQLDKALKDIATCNDDIERLASERFAIYRKCKLEELELPLEEGSLDKVPIEEANMQLNPIDVDGADDATQKIAQPENYGVVVDYDQLESEEKEVENDFDATEAKLLAIITKLAADLEKMSPNMKASKGLLDSEKRFKTIDGEFETARQNAKEAKEEFSLLKKRRCDIFNKAYAHISEKIDSVYKDLTKGKASPMGGVAYLSLEDSEEPYLHGIKYHAMPPMKRFRDMDQLSGGEKTMASLALLFAIHSYHPSPFFVLDEVDAALDATNVGRIARYCKKLANPDFQFIVISLKAAFYENASALVGIYRDGGSKALTLDLDQYAE